jgi:hypothetical protein
MKDAVIGTVQRGATRILDNQGVLCLATTFTLRAVE